MLSVIIVGINDWEKYTLPFIDSLRTHTRARIVCVDNGSQPPYPVTEGVQMVRAEAVIPYPAALNIGLLAAPRSDWYFIANNDMLIEHSFDVQDLNLNNLYGFMQYSFSGHPYLAGWGLFISQKILETVGLFDEALAPMWFEDADYSIRCVRAGFGLQTLDRKAWGIRHFEDERMTDRKAYMQKHMEARQRNRKYVMVKHGL